MSGIAPIKASPYEAPPPPTPTAGGASSRPASGDAPVSVPPILGQGTAETADAVSKAKQAKQVAATEQATKSKESAEALQKRLDEMLAEANAKTSLRFRVDKEVNRIVVSVIDDESGETIMQIPDARALAAAKRLLESGTGLLDQQA